MARQRHCRRLARNGKPAASLLTPSSSEPRHLRGKPGFLTLESGCGRETDCLLEGAGFELPVPRVLEPSQFIRLLDTAFAFCRRDRRRIGDRSHLPQALKRKELGGLPIAVGCTRSKTGRVPCLHIRWAEQCEPDILLYCSPYKCFPLEKTGCNPS